MNRDYAVCAHSPANAALRQRFMPCPRGTEVWLDDHPDETLHLLQGVLRIDQCACDGERQFVTLLLAGEVLGPWMKPDPGSVLIATALNTTLIERRPLQAERSTLMEHCLAGSTRRAAQLSTLVRGMASDRVLSLIRLFAGGHVDVVAVELPSRRDIADITALTIETVSRSISQLRRSGVLQAHHSPGVRADCSFLFHPVGGRPQPNADVCAALELQRCA